MQKRKIVCGLAGLVFALALSGGVASAHSSESSVIVFKVANLGGADCPGALFALSFDMASPGGSLLGNGVSCVQFVDPPAGCPVGMVGCRDAVYAVFMLTFAQGTGTLTAPIVLNEHWLTESTVLQVDRGTVTSGTGEFDGARGSIFCAGTVDFTTFVPNIVCVVHLS
jgi:hypothetical protein